MTLTTLFGPKCESMEEFAKFIEQNESLLQSYPEGIQQKVLSFKFPDKLADELIHIMAFAEHPC